MNIRKRKERDSDQESEPSEPTRVSPRKQTRPKTNYVAANSENLKEIHSGIALQSSIKKPKASESVRCSGERDYTSDGMSFESLADDDLLPDINIPSPFKDKSYVKNDIVWAPYKHMYWPALVTSVKLGKVCFLYVNDPNKPVYKLDRRRLLPFDNPEKNLELKEKGEEAYQEFRSAYEKVVKYLCKKKQNTNINARRYLTSIAERDKVSQAKDCLFRLTGVCESISSDNSDSKDGDDDDDAEAIDIGEDDDIEDLTEEYVDTMCSQSAQSAEERAKVQEILRDLETVPRNMTVPRKHLNAMEEKAKLLLDIIQSKDCFDHLMKIRNGLIPSSRHNKFKNGGVVHGGLGHFTLFNDLTNQLLTALDNHCDEHDGPEYKHNVMLPEAIVFAISKLDKCDKVSAKQQFYSMSKKVGIRE